MSPVSAADETELRELIASGRFDRATERAIRGPVVGRKNHYGSKSRRGTEVAAILYSILETAKLHHIDPAAYLMAALEAADRNVTLMPWQFAAAQ